MYTHVASYLRFTGGTTSVQSTSAYCVSKTDIDSEEKGKVDARKSTLPLGKNAIAYLPCI